VIDQQNYQRSVDADFNGSCNSNSNSSGVDDDDRELMAKIYSQRSARSVVSAIIRAAEDEKAATRIYSISTRNEKATAA